MIERPVRIGLPFGDGCFWEEGLWSDPDAESACAAAGSVSVPAVEFERFLVSGAARAPSLTARISGLSRLPLQASQNCGLMKLFRRLRVNSLSLSRYKRSRLGMMPSKGRLTLLTLPARQKVNST